jgi:hypothetical protein
MKFQEEYILAEGYPFFNLYHGVLMGMDKGKPRYDEVKLICPKELEPSNREHMPKYQLVLRKVKEKNGK